MNKLLIYIFLSMVSLNALSKGGSKGNGGDPIVLACQNYAEFSLNYLDGILDDSDKTQYQNTVFDETIEIFTTDEAICSYGVKKCSDRNSIPMISQPETRRIYIHKESWDRFASVQNKFLWCSHEFLGLADIEKNNFNISQKILNAVKSSGDLSKLENFGRLEKFRRIKMPKSGKKIQERLKKNYSWSCDWYHPKSGEEIVKNIYSFSFNFRRSGNKGNSYYSNGFDTVNRFSYEKSLGFVGSSGYGPLFTRESLNKTAVFGVGEKDVLSKLGNRKKILKIDKQGNLLVAEFDLVDEGSMTAIGFCPLGKTANKYFFQDTIGSTSGLSQNAIIFRRLGTCSGLKLEDMDATVVEKKGFMYLTPFSIMLESKYGPGAMFSFFDGIGSQTQFLEYIKDHCLNH